MATGSILSLTVVDSVTDAQGRSIPMRGSAVKLVIEGMGARHPINDPLFDPSSLVINIKRPGYDSATKALVPGGRSDVVKGTVAVRNGYPVNWSTLSSAANGVPARSWCSSGANGNNMYYTEAGGTKGATAPTTTSTTVPQSDGGVSWQYYDPVAYTIATALGFPVPPTNNAGFINNVVGGNVEVYVALDFPITKDDTLVSASIGAGAYISSISNTGTTGTLDTSLASASIPTLTNSTTLEYGYPVVTPVSLMHQASQGTLEVEYHVGDPWGRNSRQLSYASFQAFKWDGSASDAMVYSTSQVKSNVIPLSCPAAVCLEVVRGLVPTNGTPNGTPPGDAYVEAEFYPYFGNKPFKTKLHGEGRDFVSGTTYSGIREAIRNGANYYTLLTAGPGAATVAPTHTSGVNVAGADGYVWTWHSLTTLTGQAGTKYISSNPQARHHFLNDLGTYKRGFCCVNATGANIGAPQVWTTQAAALAAKGTDSYGSASLALIALRTFHNTAGGGTTHDDAGGGTAIFLAGTHSGFGASLAALPIGSEWVYGLADPTATAGSVILNAGSFKIAHRRMKLTGFTSVSAGSSIINSGEATALAMLTNELWMEGWDWTGITAASVAAQTSVPTSNAGLVYIRNSIMRTGGRFQVENQRSHNADMMGTRFETGGVWDIKPRTSTLGIRVVPGSLVQVSDPLNSVYLPSRMFYSFGRCSITGSATDTGTICELMTGNGIPYLGSIFETWLIESLTYASGGSSVAPCLRVGADAATTDVSRVYFQNGTSVGERTNLGYNDNGLTPLREYWFFANTIGHTRGVITDYSAHPTSAAPRGVGRFNNYPLVYQVGFRDNVTYTGVGNGTGTTSGVQRFGTNDIWGVLAGNDPGIVAQYIDNRSRDAHGTSNNVGGGDYHPSATSLARNKAVTQGWTYDLLGAQRVASGAIGALESLTVELLFAGGAATSAGTWSFATGKTLTFTGGATTASGTWTLAPGLGLTFAGGANTSSGTWTLALAKALLLSGGATTSAGTWTLYIPPIPTPPYRFAGLRNYAAFALPPENYSSGFTP